jgi:hypothetical protein
LATNKNINWEITRWASPKKRSFFPVILSVTRPNVGLESKFTMIFAPWMIEEAYRYYKASEILHNSHNMESVAQINAALSIEILFKSFHVEITESEGLVDERYKFKKTSTVCKSVKDTHDLFKLYESLPDEIGQMIWSPTREDILLKYRDVFVKSRYKYEKDSMTGYSALLSKHAGELVDSVTKYYQREGCDDLWIQAYPNV